MTGSNPQPLEQLALAPWSKHSNLTITRVRTVVTAPSGPPVVAVVVETSQAGLIGYGCATFTQRYDAVVGALETHIGPMLIGRDPRDINDINQLIHYSGYWRSGPVLNNALSGVDQALWDIAGKRLGVPVYELLGGRVRVAAPVYRHASAPTIEETVDHAQELVATGARHIRLQAGGKGIGHYGSPSIIEHNGYPDAPYPDGWDVRAYLSDVPQLFAAARERLGDQIELLHDVHHRLTVSQAITLGRHIADYEPFFLEDPIPQEQYDRLGEVRTGSGVPIAVGEQVANMADAARLVTSGSVDYLRLHTSTIGGLTNTLKIIHLCEIHGVKTAWHGPADVSPIGAAANITLNAISPAFGIQEGHSYDEAAQAVFPGTIAISNGHVQPNEAPGWGITIDETEAAKYPPIPHKFERFTTHTRALDGSLQAP